MRARGLALGAAITLLAIAGCGGDEPPPFKEVKQPATTGSTGPSATVGEPAPDTGVLATLAPRQQKALAGLAAAQAALAERGDAVASTGTDADKLVKRMDAGFEPPSGSAPEVRRLSAALTAFGTSLAAIAGQDDLMPALSAELELRYEQLVKSKPSAAAHVLDAKQEVDATLDALTGLRRKVDDAAAEAKRQLSELKLDGDALGEAITNGSESATAALNGVNQAVDAGIKALADSA
jgi:hypothetical protein